VKQHIPKRIVVFSNTQRNLLSIFRFLRVRVLRILWTLVRTVELYKTQHRWHQRSLWPPDIHYKFHSHSLRRTIGPVLISIFIGRQPTVTHIRKCTSGGSCQYFPLGLRCNFPAIQRHRPLTSIKLYCLVTETHRTVPSPLMITTHI